MKQPSKGKKVSAMMFLEKVPHHIVRDNGFAGLIGV